MTAIIHVTCDNPLYEYFCQECIKLDNNLTTNIINTNVNLIVCVLNDTVIGHLIYNVEQHIAKYYDEFVSLDEKITASESNQIVNKKIHVVSLAVDKKHRNKKIATEIIEHAFGLYNSSRVVIYFHVSVKNIVALNIYIKYGFKIVEIIENYYKNENIADTIDYVPSQNDKYEYGLNYDGFTDDTYTDVKYENDYGPEYNEYKYKSNVEAVCSTKIDEIYTGIGKNAYLMAKYL